MYKIAIANADLIFDIHAAIGKLVHKELTDEGKIAWCMSLTHLGF